MQLLLLNIVFALLAFFATRWVMGELGVERPFATLLALLVAVVVFMADLAARVI